MTTLLYCRLCNELLRSRTLLNNHVRRVHQSTVKVRFQNGEVREIQKGRDGSFTCNCGKVFKHPISVRQHGKQCIGTELENNCELDNGTSGSEDLMSEDSMNNSVVPEAGELGDCIGIHQMRIY